MTRFGLASCFFAAILIFLPSAATSQEEGPMPMTWLGMFKSNPGEGRHLEKVFEGYDEPLLARLVTDGNAMSWGFGYELAGPGDFDYFEWINVLGWAGIGHVEAVLETRQQNMSEAEFAKMTDDWLAVIKPGEKRSHLLRHIVVDAHPEVQPNYLWLSYHTAKPGRANDLVKMYSSEKVPVYATLLETGAITAYGLIEQAVHSDNSFTHITWIEFESLADLDAVEQAFANAIEETPDENEVIQKVSFSDLVRPEAHFCRVIRKMKQGG